jgi:hypothetical protein
MKSLIDHLVNKINLDDIAVTFTICDFEKNWEFSDVVLKQIADEDQSDAVR